MLKKIFEKDGIIMVFNDNKTIDECYFMMKNHHKGEEVEGGVEEEEEEDEEEEKVKKEYYITKGFTYPQIN
tara:strand:- start:1219 stop:1431 length:213 start_codon:yes stop_codon:yes gene_type:complete